MNDKSFIDNSLRLLKKYDIQYFYSDDVSVENVFKFLKKIDVDFVQSEKEKFCDYCENFSFFRAEALGLLRSKNCKCGNNKEINKTKYENDIIFLLKKYNIQDYYSDTIEINKVIKLLEVYEK